jgi:hypothetical protein
MAGTSDGTLPSTLPENKPGILFVASKVLHPNKLSPLDFASWYEETHIQEVQSTGGISGSQRYESLVFHKEYRNGSANVDIPNQNFDYDFLTVYNMPDLGFRESEAFRGLDGQSEPREELLEGLFRQVGFLTRFAEEVQVRGEGVGGTAAPFVITVATKSAEAVEGVLKVVEGKVPAWRRSRVSNVHENSLLREWKRTYMDEPKGLGIMEFEEVPGKDVLSSLDVGEGVEVGFWRLRRDYTGTERTPKGWQPK